MTTMFKPGPSASLADLSACQFLDRLKQGTVTALDYATACADRIDGLDGQLHAWESYDREKMLEKAREIDGRIAAGEPILAMMGVPVGVKDIFNTYDFPTSMGSEILKGYTPGNDARVVSNIRLEGGIVAGKTVTAEFAVHHPGPTLNPHDPARTPGTSSSGSAVAVATGMVPVALASQTGGSTIRPASYCGVMGYKPSFGLLPRTAMLKTTDTLDTIGLMARSLDDLRLCFEVTRVRGHNYPISETALADPARQKIAGRPVRIGVLQGPKTSFEAPVVKAALNTACDHLAADGFEMVPFTLPEIFEQAHDIHEHIYRRALAYYFKQEWGQAREKFSAVMQEMIEGGLAVSPEEYQRSIDLQAQLAHVLDQTMVEQGLDLIICPSTADEAPKGLYSADLPDHCLIWTMCGVPTLSLPVLSGSSGLPVGLQVVARRFGDYLLLDQAARIMAVCGKDR